EIQWRSALKIRYSDSFNALLGTALPVDLLRRSCRSIIRTAMRSGSSSALKYVMLSTRYPAALTDAISDLRL
ncbi:hypothetical protein SB781_39560, partial [Paraburkholderia sp. SIMBA_061]